MTEFFRTLRSWGKTWWFGALVAFAALVLAIRVGWIDEGFIDRMGALAVRIIGALKP